MYFLLISSIFCFLILSDLEFTFKVTKIICLEYSFVNDVCDFINTEPKNINKTVQSHSRYQQLYTSTEHIQLLVNGL